MRCRAAEYLPPRSTRGAARCPCPSRGTVPAGPGGRAGPDRRRLADHHGDAAWVRRPVAVDLVRRRSTQLVAAHPAPRRHVVAGPPGRSPSTVTTRPRRRRRGRLRPAGSPAAGSAGRGASDAVAPPGHRPGRPELRPGRRPPRRAAPRGTARRRPRGRAPTRLQRQRHPHVAVGQDAHRREDVAGLERAGGAGRAGRHREPAPVELVRPAPRRRRTGRRTSPRAAAGRPGRRRPRVGDRAPRPPGSGRPARRRAPARRPGRPSVCCQASAAARASGDHRLGVGPPDLALAGRARAGATGCAPARRAPRRRPARPTSGRRRPARRTPWGGASGPATAWASTTAVRPGRGQRCHAAASGCRVPTSPLALWTAAATVPGRPGRVSSASRSTRPARSTGTSSNRSASPAVAARWRPRVQDRGVLDAPTRPARVPRRRPACSIPSHPARSATGPGRAGSDLGRPHAEPGRDHLAGVVEQAPRLPALGVEPARVGPPRVERGQQRVARGRAAAGPPSASSSAAGDGRVRSGSHTVDA